MSLYQRGDAFTYTHPNGRAERIILQEVDEDHLLSIRLEKGGVSFAGFHVLPGCAAYAAGATTTLPAGAVKVFDEHGIEFPPAMVTVTITPDASYNNDAYNQMDAVVTVTHVGGTATAQKTFFPPAWTLTSVVQAIYDAVVRRFQARGPIPSTLTTGETAERVKIRFVYEELAPRGKDVTTAYPTRGQNLTFAHQPVLRP